MLRVFQIRGFLLENFVFPAEYAGRPISSRQTEHHLTGRYLLLTTVAHNPACFHTIDMYRKESKPVEIPAGFLLVRHLLSSPGRGPTSFDRRNLVPQFETPRTATKQQLMEGLFLLSAAWPVHESGSWRIACCPPPPMQSSIRAGSCPPWMLPEMGVFGICRTDLLRLRRRYSTCAIGAALCLWFYPACKIPGIPDAASRVFRDFLAEMHITLSSWLRDYLPYPAGRLIVKAHSAPTSTSMLTMLLGAALWHGANWFFVAWGGLHGLYSVGGEILLARTGKPAERNLAMATIPRHLRALPKLVCRNLPQIHPAGQAGPMPYSLSSWSMLLRVLHKRFRPYRRGGQDTGRGCSGAIHERQTFTDHPGDAENKSVIISVMLIIHWLLRNTRVLDLVYRLPWWLTGLVWTSMVLFADDPAAAAAKSSFISFLNSDFFEDKLICLTPNFTHVKIMQPFRYRYLRMLTT